MFYNKKKDSINDFGKQFKYHDKIDDYWGSLEMLKDIVKPFDLNSVKNKIICEIGVGSGRILKNLIKLSPKKIYAIDPSEAIDIAKKNNEDSEVEILFKKISGQMINFKNEIDYIFSLGVIHHIPEAEIVCKKIYESLKPKGKFVIWLYGKEGNELYLFIFNNLRKITRFMPDKLLNLFSIFLNLLLSVYIFFCKYLQFSETVTSRASTSISSMRNTGKSSSSLLIILIILLTAEIFLLTTASIPILRTAEI